MKFVMFVGDLGEHGQKLYEKFKQLGFYCSKVNCADEVDQVGLQCGRGAMIFCDHKLAYRFLTENTWEGFPTYAVLYLPKRPIISPDAQRKLDSVHLNVFTPSEAGSLIGKIDLFIKNGKIEESLNDEILFSVNDNLGSDNE